MYFEAAQQNNPWQSLIMVVVILLFSYMILIRPEQKRRKKMEELRNQMKVGDRVVAMGIIGTIDSISQDTVILKMVDGARIEVIKAAVTEVRAELQA